MPVSQMPGQLAPLLWEAWWNLEQTLQPNVESLTPSAWARLKPSHSSSRGHPADRPGGHRAASTSNIRSNSKTGLCPRVCAEGEQGPTRLGGFWGDLTGPRTRAVHAAPRVSLKPGNETRLSPADPLITGSGSRLSECVPAPGHEGRCRPCARTALGWEGRGWRKEDWQTRNVGTYRRAEEATCLRGVNSGKSETSQSNRDSGPWFNL